MELLEPNPINLRLDRHNLIVSNCLSPLIELAKHYEDNPVAAFISTPQTYTSLSHRLQMDPIPITVFSVVNGIGRKIL